MCLVDGPHLLVKAAGLAPTAVVPPQPHRPSSRQSHQSDRLGSLTVSVSRSLIISVPEMLQMSPTESVSVPQRYPGRLPLMSVFPTSFIPVRSPRMSPTLSASPDRSPIVSATIPADGVTSWVYRETKHCWGGLPHRCRRGRCQLQRPSRLSCSPRNPTGILHRCLDVRSATSSID